MPSPDAGVDPAVMLGDDAEAFERVCSGESTSPLAVVSGPYGARKQLLDHAADRLGATRYRVTPGDETPPNPPELGTGPVVVDDCQHLYRRTVGGFAAIEAFLDVVAAADGPVVTGWSATAWAYLSAVRKLPRTIPVHVEPTPLTAEEVAAVVVGRGDGVRFLPDDTETNDLLQLRRTSVSWRTHTVSLRVPLVNLDALERLGDSSDPKTAVCERLASVSNGNRGVATALWETQRAPELRPGDLTAPGMDLTFDRLETFCLRLVLAKEFISRGEIAEVLGEEVERVLGRLVRDELVRVNGKLVSLEPTAVPAVAAAVERGRIL